MQNLVITPKLLHKDSEDDVLLKHPRYALPSYIDEMIVQRWVEEKLDFLLELYSPDNEKNNLWSLNLPIANQGLIDLFGRAISLDARWQSYRAIPYQIIEREFSELYGTLLQKLENFQTDTNNIDLTVTNLFCSTSYKMINDADHYFFYRKKHEHVPGIMLIEAQRQAVYAHIYSTTQYVRGKVTISLGKLNSVFYCYVDLMYPVELVVDELRENHQSRSKKTYRVSFFQQCKIVAIIDTEVDIIEMEQFKRIRNLFIHAKDDYCYKPIRTNEIKCSLVDLESHEYVVDCISISRDRCITTRNNLTTNKICKITIKNDGITFVSQVELESISSENISWKFSDLNHDQLINMGEIIKREFIHYN